MNYGKIAASDSVNTAIYNCFSHLSEATARAYVEKFAEQPHDQDQVKHTFRELILGAFLASNGFVVESDRRIDGKTPDWTILEYGDPKCIVEVTTFHTNKDTKDAIQTHLATAGFAWVYQPDHTGRLYQSIQTKYTVYKDIVETNNLPYIAGVFLDFDAAVNPEQIDACLFDKEAGLFAAYHYVSGVLTFTETIATYEFTYLCNPHALRPYSLPGGALGPDFFRQASH